MDLNIKLIDYGSAEQKKSVELRWRILREPLGLHFTESELKDEDQQIHIACFLDNILIGILILVKLNKTVLKMRQVAVDNDMQNKGVGRQMVMFAEKWGRKNHFGLMSLHARKTAVKFYRSLHYETVGEEFLEVGIPHIKMKKILTS